MITFIMVIHAAVCVLLGCIILMQSGRGGGLTENFASAESIFGAQTNTLLVKTTTILASLFIVTCLSLAIMHSMKGKSLMSERVAVPSQSKANMPLPQSTAQVNEMANQTKEQAAQTVATIDPATPKAVDAVGESVNASTANMEEKVKDAVAEINESVSNVDKINVPAEAVQPATSK